MKLLPIVRSNDGSGNLHTPETPRDLDLMRHFVGSDPAAVNGQGLEVVKRIAEIHGYRVVVVDPTATTTKNHEEPEEAMNIELLNKGRIREGFYASDDSFGFTGAFLFRITGCGNPVDVRVIASDMGGWEHVSVSLVDKPTTTPNWAVMCRIKDLFWDEEQAVIQIHPAKSDHVNHHEGCLHLWRCTRAEQPLPPSSMVGPKP